MPERGAKGHFIAGPTRPIEERFWEKVDKNGPIPEYAPHLGNCWLWTATRVPKGYGSFQLRKNHPVPAYRFAYGEVPAGLELDHLCRVPACVRPSHLEAVTHQVNLQGERYHLSQNES